MEGLKEVWIESKKDMEHDSIFLKYKAIFYKYLSSNTSLKSDLNIFPWRQQKLTHNIGRKH